MARQLFPDIQGIATPVTATATTTTAIAIEIAAANAARIGFYICNTGGTNALLVRLRTDVSADITTGTATFIVPALGYVYVPAGPTIGIDVEAAAATTTFTVTEVLGA